MQKVRLALGALAVSAALVAGTATQEGKSNKAYLDRLPSVPVVTICYGHTATARMGQVKTDTECNDLLRKDLNDRYAPIVRRLVRVPLSQGEFDALVDFTYNVGEGNFARSTLLKLVNARRYEDASMEFAKWRYVGGKDCALAASKCGGIPLRREWEERTFRGE